MKHIVLSVLLFTLSFSHAFAVKISLEEVNYHTDCKGPVKSVKETDGNEVTISYYTEDGRFLRKDQLTDGKPNIVSSMKYNKAGSPVEYIKNQRTTVLKYNSQQQLIAIEEKNGDQKLDYSEKQYNPKGLECRVLAFRTSGDYDVMGEFAYDENNNISEIRSYKCRRGGWKKTGLIKREYGENNVLKAEYWYDYGWDNTTPKLKKKKFFNKDGKVETDLSCTSDGVAYDTTTYTYDEQGNVTKRCRTNTKLYKEILTKTYTYDKYGNPTEIRTVVLVKDEKVDYSNTQKFEYEYYPTDKTTIEPVKAKTTGDGPTAKLEREGKWAQSFNTLTELAAQGNREAQCRLAFYYYTATATPVNYQKAAELYRMAADKGSAEAQYNLGNCYFMGTGVEQSVDEACKWVVKAAENGYKKAYYDAALLLQIQAGGNTVSEKAMEYFRKSAATGYQPAKIVMQAFEQYQKKQEEKKKKEEEAKKPVKHKGKEIAIAAVDELVVTSEPVAVVETEEKHEPDTDDFVYVRVEEKASYVGGISAYREYLKQNLVYPEQEKQEGTQGKVYVEFTVNKDGSITDITVISSSTPGFANEAISFLEGMPKWKPAKNRGKTVRSKVRWIIPFKLE
ncbi:MAG: TonB family protein [Paludibacteraceae bacterium]|nr:TonB family protein [Paludibacteraceae bacterium]